MDNQKLRVKNVFKLVRTVLEVFVIVFVIVWAVWSLVSYRSEQRVLKAEAELDCAMVSSDEIVAGYKPTVVASGPHFIAVSYNGITDVERKDGKIVTKAAYEEQMQSLKDSGYQTITQQDGPRCGSTTISPPPVPTPATSPTKTVNISTRGR